MKHTLFYFVTILAFCLATVFVLKTGEKRFEMSAASAAGAVAAAHSNEGASPSIRNRVLNSLQHPISVLLLQIVVIVTVAKLFGAAFNKIGQPAVIGEMVAGIALGPSLFGQFSPAGFQIVFPKASFGPLQLISQLGILLFMTTVGMETDLSVLKKKAQSAVIISHVSILLPFFLGTALSTYLFSLYGMPGTRFSAFALFMGIAMSITAFPVLARILKDKGLTETSLGSIVIACAAADDMTAWCLLAVVVSICSSQSPMSALVTVALSLAFVFVMLLAVKPWFRKHVEGKLHDTSPSPRMLLLISMLSALYTEMIGIHALFGAFFAGVIMSDIPEIRAYIRQRLWNFSSFFLPLFFAFTGLRTQIGLLNDARAWTACLLILAVAILGKFGGSAIAARVTGMGTRDSLATGVLMNTRGLMELVVLNIGYDLGIISPEIFTMMVIMALVTTFMAGPLLGLIRSGAVPAKTPRI